MTKKDPNFEFFEQQLPTLLKEHKGQFVVIRNQAIDGFYPTMEEAFRAASEKFADNDFLIQEITDEKHLNYINV